MAVYGYIRVSTEEQVEGTSLDEQRRVITGNAMVQALHIDRWLEDAVSGALPFMQRLADHGVELRAGDVLIVSKLDRFSRDLRDALNTIEACKQQGVRLIIDGHGDVTDEGNLVARLMLEIMLAFAGHERRIIKDRQIRGQRAKRQKNGHLGGDPPFGYRVVGRGKAAMLEPDPVTHPALATIRQLHAQGYSSRKISAALMQYHALKVSHVAVCRVVSRLDEEMQ